MKPESHTIGAGTFTIGDPGADDGPFHDVRDLLVAAPRFGGHGYATLDLFPVRHKIIRELDPPPMAVFEFGSLLGYFLMTACDAAPSISRVGWIDPEVDEPGSNERCAANVRYVFEQRGETPQWVWYDTITRNCREFDFADLVQVDGAHTYTDCFTDLMWALELRPTRGPLTIMVDDYKAIAEVARATDDFARLVGRRVEYHETRNGLAVLRDVRPPP